MEEARMISGIKNKDKDIFDFVFHHYYSGLCVYAYNYCKDREVVKDIVQDIFLELWLKGNALKIETSLKNYLFTSVKYKTIDYLKHTKVKDKHQPFILKKLYSEDDSDQYMIESELQQFFEKALSLLSPRCRLIFEKSRLQGMKNDQIAQELNISKRTVELQISNALKTIRTKLSGMYPVFIFLILMD